jgi:hypothetical protein
MRRFFAVEAGLANPAAAAVAITLGAYHSGKAALRARSLRRRGQNWIAGLRPPRQFFP